MEARAVDCHSGHCFHEAFGRPAQACYPMSEPQACYPMSEPQACYLLLPYVAHYVRLRGRQAFFCLWHIVMAKAIWALACMECQAIPDFHEAFGRHGLGRT